MGDEPESAVLTVLLPVLIETAVLEILEYIHTAESMTATEVLQMVASQQSRKTEVMSRYMALVDKIKAREVPA